MQRLNHIQMRILKLSIILFPSKRTQILKKSDIFAYMGENCIYCSSKIPEEPYMVKLHNNVVISAGVNFITHDIMNMMFLKKINKKPDEVLPGFQMGTIEVYDNVAIGLDTIILPNTKIGPNAIVAAGSVVVKDVPEGSIVGGNPAKVIGNINDLFDKRILKNKAPTDQDSIDKIMDYYWKESSQ